MTKYTRAKAIINIRHGEQDRSDERYDDSSGDPLSAELAIVKSKPALIQ